MKKQDVTFQDKLNELRLDIAHPNNREKTFVLLEGDSDIRLFRKLFKLDKCKVESVPGGKIKLENCVVELAQRYSLIIGIRDADFIHLGHQSYSKANFFLTDLHDMEMMIISEDEVFSALLFEYTTLQKDEHSEVRSNIMVSIEKIGLLKWLNDIENLEYKFDSGFQDLVSFVKSDIEFAAFFGRILSKSPNAKLTDILIVQKKLMDLKENRSPVPFQLCNGHDFMKAFAQFVRKNGVGKTLDNETMSSIFRMLYSLSHFKKTRLFYDIKLWADSNSCVLFD